MRVPIVSAVSTPACNDDAADTASSAPPTTSSAPGAGSPSAAPTLSTSASPRATPSKKAEVTGGQVIMSDPDGKKYTRKWVIRNAMMMAGMSGKLPSNFCDKSYAEGVKGGQVSRREARLHGRVRGKRQHLRFSDDDLAKIVHSGATPGAATRPAACRLLQGNELLEG